MVVHVCNQNTWKIEETLKKKKKKPRCEGREVRSPGTRVTEGCELPCEGWKLNQEKAAGIPNC